MVWVTKYRYHVLVGEVQHRCRELLIQICESEEVEILKGAVSKDHVHMHIEYWPKHSVSNLVKQMKEGSVIIDLNVSQGGCFETSKATTHSEPTYEVDGIVHYCVANMPGAVPLTSTVALTNATLPYALKIADQGWQKVARESTGVKAGLHVVCGKVTYAGVAEAFGLDYTAVEDVLG